MQMIIFQEGKTCVSKIHFKTVPINTADDQDAALSQD